jgi:hypothetical protein
MPAALQLLQPLDELDVNVADVVMLRSGRNSRVVDLRVKGVTRLLQRGLTFDPSDIGKYVLALVLDEGEYFSVPGRDKVYSNGFDSCTNLSEAFSLFDSIDRVKEFLCGNFLFSDEFVVFVTLFRNEQVFFDECALYHRTLSGLRRVAR